MKTKRRNSKGAAKRTGEARFAAARGSAPTDTERLNWLERHVVYVRTPLVHGSHDLFWESPDEETGASQLRTKIDAALAQNGGS